MGVGCILSGQVVIPRERMSPISEIYSWFAPGNQSPAVLEEEIVNLNTMLPTRRPEKCSVD